MSFKSMNYSRFFGWFFRDNKGVAAPIARPRLINNSLPVVFNESRNRIRYWLSISAKGQDMRRYHCCYFCKTAADFRRPGRVATTPSRRVAFRHGAMRRRNSIVSLFRKNFNGRCWVPVDLWRDRPKELHTQS